MAEDAKWEYGILVCKGGPTNLNFSSWSKFTDEERSSRAFQNNPYVPTFLDEIGAQGWELVSVSGFSFEQQGQTLAIERYIFKRKLLDIEVKPV